MSAKRFLPCRVGINVVGPGGCFPSCALCLETAQSQLFTRSWLCTDSEAHGLREKFVIFCVRRILCVQVLSRKFMLVSKATSRVSTQVADSKRWVRALTDDTLFRSPRKSTHKADWARVKLDQTVFGSQLDHLNRNTHRSTVVPTEMDPSLKEGSMRRCV